MAKMINAIGFYTKEQYEDLEKRNAELWGCLNRINAFLGVYGDSLRYIKEKSEKGGSKDYELLSWAGTIADKMTHYAGMSREALDADTKAKFGA